MLRSVVTLFGAVLIATPVEAKPPRLTLFISVDAMGSDLLLRSRPRLKAGLAQLMSQGAFFPTARYEYAENVTAAGHATLATGANPWRHGINSNRFLDRRSGKVEPIFFDPEHPALESPPNSDDVSPKNLLAETVSDRLRLSTRAQGKSISISSKGRAAIALAGKLGQAYWFNQRVGKFVSGTWHTKELSGWAKSFNDKKLPDSMFDKKWELSAPAKSYEGVDDRPFESDWYGLGRAFPHPLNGGLPGPGPQSYAALAASPLMNDLLVQLARAAIAAEGLGKDEVPDLLSVSFSGLDMLAHLFGPYSWEAQDAMIRLDKSIGELVSAAEKAAGGRGNLLVVLSADHGGAAVPEEWVTAGLEAKRLSSDAFAQWVDRALATRYGPGKYVAAVEEVDVYLNDKLLSDKKLDKASVRRAAASALSEMPEIALAVAKDDLFGADPSANLLRSLRLGYQPDRSGDVLFVTKPYMVQTDEPTGTSHGTPYSYDAQVPVVFYGKGVRPGLYRKEINPTDVAPTICSILELSHPAMSEGTVRSEALSDR